MGDGGKKETTTDGRHSECGSRRSLTPSDDTTKATVPAQVLRHHSLSHESLALPFQTMRMERGPTGATDPIVVAQHSNKFGSTFWMMGSRSMIWLRSGGI
uniref:Uncharacterized protein n=1 Tax=Globodera rostochiensis TaxID=31243 RepID=A0A914HE29_GLORO